MTDVAPIAPTTEAWQSLPQRAARLAALEGAFGGLFVPGLPLAAAAWFFDLPGGLWTAALGLLIGILFGAWLGRRPCPHRCLPVARTIACTRGRGCSCC